MPRCSVNQRCFLCTLMYAPTTSTGDPGILNIIVKRNPEGTLFNPAASYEPNHDVEAPPDRDALVSTTTGVYRCTSMTPVPRANANTPENSNLPWLTFDYEPESK
ncbi:hypothetical protein EDD21DRAFT_387678 [Dissophora ornata]|nr:hypothetical protein EDD21DRAFT_387678 [Dissophora ornata]